MTDVLTDITISLLNNYSFQSNRNAGIIFKKLKFQSVYTISSTKISCDTLTSSSGRINEVKFLDYKDLYRLEFRM